MKNCTFKPNLNKKSMLYDKKRNQSKSVISIDKDKQDSAQKENRNT